MEADLVSQYITFMGQSFDYRKMFQRHRGFGGIKYISISDGQSVDRLGLHILPQCRAENRVKEAMMMLRRRRTAALLSRDSGTSG